MDISPPSFQREVARIEKTKQETDSRHSIRLSTAAGTIKKTLELKTMHDDDPEVPNGQSKIRKPQDTRTK